MADQFVREPLMPEAADRLSNACEATKEKLIIWTLLDTGLRIGELCSLTPSNILWQQKMIRVKGKGGKKRVVPMSNRVRSLLENYFAIHDKWFVKKRRAQYIVKEVANKARLPEEVTAHVLRHTNATLALQKGISIGAVKKMLGHSKLETTARYLNYTDAHIQEEYQNKW